MTTDANNLHVPVGSTNLPGQWTWAHLEDLCEGVFDCPHSTPILTAIGPYVVRTQDISSGVLRTENSAHVSEHTYIERTRRAAPRRGDLLYSREGTYFGIAAEVPENTEVCLGQRMVLIRPDRERIHFRYLRHWLNSPQMAAHIHGFRDGSVAERLNLPTIRSLPILLPPTVEQQAIADVLGALDDKIAVNERIVSACAELATRSFARHVWDYGRGGSAPDGYTVGRVEDLCERIGNGGTPKRNNPQFWTDGDVEWYKTGELRDGPLIAPSERIASLALSGSSCSVWRPRTVLVALYASPTVGRLGILTRPAAFNQACSALQAKEGIGEFVLFETLKAIRGDLQKIAVGAAQQNISQAVLRAHRVVVPSTAAAKRFHDRAGALFQRQVAAMLETKELARLRDTLLPKLMSGELRLRDAERVVEDAT